MGNTYRNTSNTIEINSVIGFRGSNNGARHRIKVILEVI
jgi:hypothetical protein